MDSFYLRQYALKFMAKCLSADSPSWFRRGIDISSSDPWCWSYIVSPKFILDHFLFSFCILYSGDDSFCSAEDEEAGEIPVAFVVRKPGSMLTSKDVIDYVAKQVVSVPVFNIVSLMLLRFKNITASWG